MAAAGGKLPEREWVIILKRESISCRKSIVAIYPSARLLARPRGLCVAGARDATAGSGSGERSTRPAQLSSYAPGGGAAGGAVEERKDRRRARERALPLRVRASRGGESVSQHWRVGQSGKEKETVEVWKATIRGLLVAQGQRQFPTSH